MKKGPPKTPQKLLYNGNMDGTAEIPSEEILAHLFVKVCEKPLTNTGESYIIYRQHDDKAVLHGASASVNMSMEKYSSRPKRRPC